MKKITRMLILSIFSLMLSMSSVFAGEETPQKIKLSVDQAVDYALINSRSLKSDEIDLEIKKRAALYSWNVFVPSVSATGTMARSKESNYSTILSGIASGISASTGTNDNTGTNVKTGTYYSPSYVEQNILPYASDLDYVKDNESAHWTSMYGVNASLNLSLAYIASIQKAKVEYEGGLITYEQNNRSTVMNIRKLFYALLLQQESLKIQKTTLKNAYDRMVQAETSYKNGSIPELALLQTQVNYQNTKPSVDTAERALNQQLDTFAFLLGMPVGTVIELEGSIDPVYITADSDELLSRYSSNDLSIRSLDNTIRTLKLGSNAIDLSTWFPAVSLNYSYGKLLPYGLDFDRYSDSDNWSDNNSAFSVTLAWNLTNMLPFSTNAQNKKDLNSNLEKLELSRITLLENQKVQVRKAVDTLNEARDQIEAMGRTVKLAQRSYEVTLRNYRSGMTELLDVRDAETSLNQAKLGQLNQKFNYITALMDLENTLNTDLIKEYADNPENKQ